MKISEKKVVEISYELFVDGKIVDSVEETKPIDYIQGMDMLIPKFEEFLEGKEEGESFNFTILSNDGYGEYDPKLRFDVPKTSFEVDGKVNEDILQVDNVIPMLNAYGEVVKATVIEVKENDVTMDFNHPLAGKDLNFVGKIISVRDASEKELREGLHGEFLEYNCGCGCGEHHHHHDEGCGCGEHHHHHDEGCGCGGHHHHHDEGCGCGGHHHHDEGCGEHHHDKNNSECNCGPDCTCGCQEGKECTCNGDCNC